MVSNSFFTPLITLISSLVPSLTPSVRTSFPTQNFEPTFGFTKFIDPLPNLPRIQIKPTSTGWSEITVKMSQFQTKLHSDLPVQTVWGYNGSTPGPMIEVEKGQGLRVHWVNQLPKTHLFPVPKGMNVALSLGLCLPTAPDVRTVTHLHGAEVSETNPMDRLHNSDGWPDAWILPGQQQIADYPNRQEARTLWFHDHAMGTTGRNVAAGLVGVYAIHDAYERSLGLPSGQYDIPLVIQSHAFDADGMLQYTDDIGVEHYGNTIGVNGKLWPYLHVEPRKYRFRIVNASNARTYGMRLVDAEDGTFGPAFYQIGSDSGFLETTVLLNDPKVFDAPRLILAPGERADIVIDFSQSAGKTFLLHNNSRDAGDGELALPEVMQFKVSTQLSHADTSRLPAKFRPIPRMSTTQAVGARRVVFGESKTPSGSLMLTLNGKSWNDPIEEKPVLGNIEVWELMNTLPDIHPFHMHLVQFQVLDRTPFDVDQYQQHGKLILGKTVAPDPNEMGWKDTVQLPGRAITRIIMRFLPYAGYYVYHCHILEHEDMDMMRPFQVVAPTQNF